MMKFFIKKGYIRSNPCRDIDPLKKVDTEPRYTPYKHEVEKVLNHLDGWKKTMVMLAAGSGLRISEILALEWDNIKGDTISVEASAVKTKIGTPKTKHSRRKVRVDKRLKLRLQEMRLQSTSSFLFLNSNGRLFSSVDVLNRVLYPAIAKADVPKFGFHGLRRFYENELEAQGVMKDHIQRLMGHEIGSKVTDKHYRVVRQERIYVCFIKRDRFIRCYAFNDDLIVCLADKLAEYTSHTIWQLKHHHNIIFRFCI
jgi:integrase